MKSLWRRLEEDDIGNDFSKLNKRFNLIKSVKIMKPIIGGRSQTDAFNSNFTRDSNEQQLNGVAELVEPHNLFVHSPEKHQRPQLLCSDSTISHDQESDSRPVRQHDSLSVKNSCCVQYHLPAEVVNPRSQLHQDSRTRVASNQLYSAITKLRCECGKVSCTPLEEIVYSEKDLQHKLQTSCSSSTLPVTLTHESVKIPSNYHDGDQCMQLKSVPVMLQGPLCDDRMQQCSATEDQMLAAHQTMMLQTSQQKTLVPAISHVVQSSLPIINLEQNNSCSIRNNLMNTSCFSIPSQSNQLLNQQCSTSTISLPQLPQSSLTSLNPTSHAAMLIHPHVVTESIPSGVPVTMTLQPSLQGHVCSQPSAVGIAVPSSHCWSYVSLPSSEQESATVPDAGASHSQHPQYCQYQPQQQMYYQ